MYDHNPFREAVKFFEENNEKSKKSKHGELHDRIVHGVAVGHAFMINDGDSKKDFGTAEAIETPDYTTVKNHLNNHKDAPFQTVKSAIDAMQDKHVYNHPTIEARAENEIDNDPNLASEDNASDHPDFDEYVNKHAEAHLDGVESIADDESSAPPTDTLNMKPALSRKREHHEGMVRAGTLTQAEFDHLERQGEFNIKEGHDFDDFDTQIQSDELPGQGDYEAEQSHKEHEEDVRKKILAFVARTGSMLTFHHQLKEIPAMIHAATFHYNTNGVTDVRIPRHGSAHDAVSQWAFAVPHDSDNIRIMS